MGELVKVINRWSIKEEVEKLCNAAVKVNAALLLEQH